MSKAKQKIVLMILDGWGLAPSWGGNAISMARKPNLDQFWKKFPHLELKAAEEAVGLPHNEMGNSEVGHLNLGCGQIVYQNLPGITSMIGDGSFFTNKALLGACEQVKSSGSALHLLGLVSDGGIHSYNGHLYALLELAKAQKVEKVYIHMITDGRDTDPMKALSYLAELQAKIKEIGVGQIASIMGRYYGMDRDKHWDRTQKAYDVLAKGVGPVSDSPEKIISENYRQSKTDEFIIPTIINRPDSPFRPISANDALIFFNFRADRTRQMISALVGTNFKPFDRRFIPNFYFATFSFLEEYLNNPTIKIVFELSHSNYPLARVLSEANLTQCHIAETEKYAHVTFFFNGGKEALYPGEKHFLIQSPRVATFDLAPEMAARQIAQKVLSEYQNFDFTVVNFANADMVGHTGNIKATMRACETVDTCVGRIVNDILKNNHVAIVTADHGNAEEKLNPESGEPYTEHTINPVPFILCSNETALQQPLRRPENGWNPALSDVAPTILDIFGINKPEEMTGESLLVAQEKEPNES